MKAEACLQGCPGDVTTRIAWHASLEPVPQEMSGEDFIVQIVTRIVLYSESDRYVCTYAKLPREAMDVGVS
jgi:hypothetical protein